MIEKERWFDVDNVKAKAKALWEAPVLHMRPDALEKYQKFFDEKCQKSKELTDEARTCIPGAVQHNLSINYPFPVAMKKIEDAYFWDVDGNKYVNYLQAGGPTMLGSNDPEIREKVIELLNGDGPITGLFSEYELLLTKEVMKLIPHVEMLRLFASGSEADMAMARLARAYTGKPNIIKHECGYHGWNDTFEYDYGIAGLKEALSVGVPAYYHTHVQAVPSDDIPAMRAQLEENEKTGGTAAVVVEPFGPNGGAMPVHQDYLQQLRDLCDEFGTLLVYDEVITAFRVDIGGAAGFFGVKPDLSVFGKVIMGGYPMAGGVGGRREIVQHFAPPKGAGYGKVHVGGTLSANPMCCLAGYYSLKKMQEIDACGKAAEASMKLGEGIQKIFDKYNLPFSVYVQPAIVHIDVTGTFCIRVTEETQAEFQERYPEREQALNEFAMGLMAEGIVTLSGRRLYTSSAVTDEVVEETLEKFDRLFSSYAPAE